MKKNLFTALILLMFISIVPLKAQLADPTIINLTRTLSRDLFEYNGVKYAQPIVKVANASTNARFYNNAFVPKKVEKPYFRFSLNGMLGFVNDDLKSFSPKYPMQDYNNSDMHDFVSISATASGEMSFNIKDTVGLYEYILLNMLYDGFTKGIIDAPEALSTALGSKELQYLDLPMDSLFKLHPLYSLLPPDQRDELAGLLGTFPSRFPMTSGSDINTLILGVPQIEIGSFMGTELLIRFIPPMDLGKTFGDFSFWGLGIKHSISQYFNPSDKDRLFDLAIQGVYQNTHLKNKIGVTNAELTADANIFNINIHGSKEISDWFTAYAGVSYEQTNIAMDYLYYIPIEIQRQLGLIDADQEGPTPGFPGDQDPQLTQMDLSEQQFKLSLGTQFNLGDFDVVMDYSISKFNIFSLGVRYTLYKPEF